MGNYWQRLNQQRLSRRRFLAASAAAAAGFAVACTGNDKTRNAATAAPTPAKVAVSAQGRGGVLRTSNFDAITLDSFDPHQTEFLTITNMHSSVFSKLLKYDDEVQGIISPDLAASMPEIVDETTYVVRIRRDAKFHDTPRIRRSFPDVAGRPITAEDVKYSIDRQRDASSPAYARYFRRDQWASVERIDVVDPYTLRMTTKTPMAPFVHYLADRTAFVIARELVDASDEMNHPDKMVGSGPFMLDEFRALDVARVVRNPGWFGADDLQGTLGGGRPFLDGYEAAWSAQSDTATGAAFLSKQIDSAVLLNPTTVARDGVETTEYGNAGTLNTSLLIDRPPFDDARVRRAIHLAVDRRRLGEQLFTAPPGKRAFLPSGPVAWPLTRWALPQGDLEKKPGYRSDGTGRDEDIAEARQLWEAARSDGRAPQSTPALFAGQPLFIPQVALPQMERSLQETLGLRLNTEVDASGYTQIFKCLSRNHSGDSEGTCGFTWGFDNGWIDLDDWLYPYFHSSGTKNSFRLHDERVDRMLDAQRREFEYDRRRQIGFDLQNLLLDEINPRLWYVNAVARSPYWGYIKNNFTSTWLGDNFRLADVWLDRSHAAFNGRSA